MKTGIIVTLRTTDAIELDSTPKILKNNIVSQTAKLIEGDDPQLIGYEIAALEDYEVFDRKWLAPADAQVSNYTYISVLLKDDKVERLRYQEAALVLELLKKFKSGKLKFHSIALKAHPLFDEVHLRFWEMHEY